MDKHIFEFVLRVLRRASYKWPARTIAKKDARIERGVYECNYCKKHFGPKEINIDHIVPVIPIHGSTDLNEIVPRLFCPSDGLQVLCKPCHKVKTQAENKRRRQYRK